MGGWFLNNGSCPGRGWSERKISAVSAQQLPPSLAVAVAELGADHGPWTIFLGGADAARWTAKVVWIFFGS